MKVGVVGCGAVGSYYGARLALSGEDVHFLLRSDYEAVSAGGVSVESPLGDFHAHPACARSPEEIGPCDLVIVALKTTANDQFPRLVPPLVGSQTAVLTLQNGLGNEEALAECPGVGPERVLGGLCFVCLNRTAPGRIRHVDHGAIVLGEFKRPPTSRVRQLAAMFERSGVPCEVAENLEQAHWEKLAWNIPFNGLGVASAAGYEAVMEGMRVSNREAVGECWTVDRLLADPRWATLVRELMNETVAAARSLGFPLRDSLVEELLARTRTMGAYKASTVIDFENRRPLELESLFLRPLRLAESAGVSTPRLRALSRVLESLDPR